MMRSNPDEKKQPLAWLKIIERMKRQKSYKPILLLSIISEIENGNLTENKIPLNDSITKIFESFYLSMENEKASNLAYLPFFYLKRDVWDLIWKSSSNKTRPSSNKSAGEKIKHAIFKPALFKELLDPVMREQIKERLFLKAEEEIKLKDDVHNESFTVPRNIEYFLNSNFGRVKIKPSLDKNSFIEIDLDFVQEKFLQEFLIDNWEKISDFQQRNIQIYGGKEVGIEYNTKTAGRIDILAEEKNLQNFTVIELKKGLGKEEHLGQLLKYMGWVEAKLSEGRDVYGILIASKFRKSMKYAISGLLNVSTLTYELKCQLHPVNL